MSFTCVRPKIHSCIIGYVCVYIFCLIRDDCVVCLMHIQYSHKEMKNATLIFSYPGHFLYRCKSCSNACKACRYLDRWPTRLTPRVYLCSDGTYHGFQDTSVCLFQCKWWISVCAQVCVGEKKKKKSENYISISGVMLGISGPWGHLTSLFINLLPDWKYSCCSPSPPHPRLLWLFVTFLLSGSFSSARLLLFFLLWGEHWVMLMKAMSFVISAPACAAGQQGRGIWEIIPHFTERQVKNGEE